MGGLFLTKLVVLVHHQAWDALMHHSIYAGDSNYCSDDPH